MKRSSLRSNCPCSDELSCLLRCTTSSVCLRPCLGVKTIRFWSGDIIHAGQSLCQKHFVTGTGQHQSLLVPFNHIQSITSVITFNLDFFFYCHPLCFAVGFGPTIVSKLHNIWSGVKQTQRLMFFLGGVLFIYFFILGAGRLLVKESIWLDSLTNCIKRQSCPWSAPQLIDGSTQLHRKSSRQSRDKSVACFFPTHPPPPCTDYLPTSPIFPPPPTLSSHTKRHRIQIYSKSKSNSFNLYVLTLFVHTCIVKTQISLSDTLYVNLLWKLSDSEFTTEAVTNFIRLLCFDQMKLNPALFF